MLGFLKRIPGLLGIRKAVAPGAGSTLKPGGGRKLGGSAEFPGEAAKQQRGRGTGRGITPPARPKPKKPHPGKR